jgi:hypothetical protein
MCCWGMTGSWWLAGGQHLRVGVGASSSPRLSRALLLVKRDMLLPVWLCARVIHQQTVVLGQDAS